jgi:hypothetical protein
MYWEYKMVTVQPAVQSDREKLDNVLKEGWEPYAVTWDGHVWDHHLRRQISIVNEIRWNTNLEIG